VAGPAKKFAVTLAEALNVIWQVEDVPALAHAPPHPAKVVDAFCRLSVRITVVGFA
jgi:hypothetical protein